MIMTVKTPNDKTRRFIGENFVEAIKVYLESDRTRGAILRGILLTLLTAFLISGCMAAYSPTPLSANHPANPAAPEAPPSPPSQAFRSENIPPAPVEKTPAQDPHMRHGMMHGGH